jgi:hypothetical protein
MSDVHNLKSYKESLALLPDIENILNVLSLTELALVNYIHYIPVYKVLCSTRDQKKLLEIHYKELLYIKNSKGKKI